MNNEIETTVEETAVETTVVEQPVEESTVVEQEVIEVETPEAKLARLQAELAELGLVVAKPASLPTAKKLIVAVALFCPKKDCETPVLNSKGGQALNSEIAGPGHTFKCSKCGTEFKSPASAFIY